ATGTLRARRGARLAAITSGGAIPDNNNYAVVQWPEELRVGEIDEDFAIESMAGDIFQLGNTAWRIRRVEAGRVIVEDAHGLPPTIPFWLGEAPARTRELSDEVSALRGEIDGRLAACEGPDGIAGIERWLADAASMSRGAAAQLVAYLAAGRGALGAVPTRDLIVAERFFDEGGGMQLVLHAPLGGRINRAWGLALRKRFCRSFDFELQAAATDDGIVISLGQPHSFPLETVFGFVPAAQSEEILVQAMLDRPMFEVRWRWNATRSLTVLRRMGGKKVPPQLVKMRVADLLSVVFPAAQACLENVVGDRELPDHPLVFETVRDCLVEALDAEGLRELCGRIERGEVQVLARDTVEPSVLCHELLNANPYAFLDDAPLEERRTRAVNLRRTLRSDQLEADAALDAAAIDAAEAEVAPVVRDRDELHDALLALWLVPAARARTLDGSGRWLDDLAEAGRAVQLRWSRPVDAAATPGGDAGDGADGAHEHVAWVATERLAAVLALVPDATRTPCREVPAWSTPLDPDAAAIRIVGGWLDHGGPRSARQLADTLGLAPAVVLGALLWLEGDGAILRGSFRPGAPPRSAAGAFRDALAVVDDPAHTLDVEWCNRRVLARIHRLTLMRLRREIEPVNAAALMRFLLRWQRVARGAQLLGADGLARVIEQLQGFETAAGAWEREVLPARLHGYDASWLDQMCLGGQVTWCRLSPRKKAVAEAGDDGDAANAGDDATAAAAAPRTLADDLQRILTEHADDAYTVDVFTKMARSLAAVAPLDQIPAEPTPAARTAPSRAAPLTFMMRADAAWLRAPAALRDG
ncbi:MAG: DEAD/DEAH box helicase, partial [Myxococcales bacterium]|nr:DEAD/DEAH box helicase [Myxococcales bacterium]